MSNYWQINLHPRHLESFDEAQFNLAMDEGIIGMIRGWENDGGMPIAFRYEVAIGDIILVLHRGASALVEVISDAYENNQTNKFWFDIVRKVKVLSREGEKYSNLFIGDWREGIHPRAAFRPVINNRFILYWLNEIYKSKLEERNADKGISLDNAAYRDDLKERLLSLFQDDNTEDILVEDNATNMKSEAEKAPMTNVSSIAIEITINIVQ